MPPPFHTIIMQKCDLLDTALILCDVTNSTKSDVTAKPTEVVQLSNTHSRNKTDGQKYVTCPQGHMTHDFLSCDLLSLCLAVKEKWGVVNTETAWDVPPFSSCLSKRQPPPPSFPCSNGLQHVPYTLVCDHQNDCQDGSDDRFCHFSPCSLDQLPCGGSHQVGYVSKD